MYSLSDDDTGKPKLFPKEVWQYVRDDDRQNVKARWEVFSTDRIKEIVTLLPKELELCKARPKQKQYMEAMLYANIDSLYQEDETMPTVLKDTPRTAERDI